VTEKLISADVAAPSEPSAAIDAVIRHVPAVTNVTTPLEDPTVHTDVVADVYVLAPAPVDAVAVSVGAVAYLL